MNATGRRGRTALVLGGGVGGVVAATRLRQRLPRTDRVVLVEREAQHVFQPSLLWLAVGARPTTAVQRPFDRLRRRGVEVVRATVESMDPGQRTVRAGGQALSADALIVALGAELAEEAVPGLEAAGHDLYTLAGATAVRDALAKFDAGRIVILTATPSYKCPAAPYEAAMLIEAALRHRGVRDRAQLDLYTAEARPMAVTGPAVSGAVRQLVESKGLRYYPEHQVIRADAARRRVDFANGATASFDLLIYVPPHRAPAVVRNAGLTNESGWIPVDRHTLATVHPGVFAIGDVTTVPLAIGKPLPKAGMFAHEHAQVVAANIVHDWTGWGARRAFDGHGKCFVETGDGKAGIGAGDFYAEPSPQVALRRPGRRWHWGKVLFEKKWFRDWF